MGESAQLTSSQQEAEDHLQQSRQAIQDLQAALRNAQVGHAQATTRISGAMRMTQTATCASSLGSYQASQLSHILFTATLSS